MENQKKEMAEAALKLTREQVKKHSLGKLEFLAAVGTRPWGIAQSNVDYDYRGVYRLKLKNEVRISEIYINNHAKDITMVQFEKFVKNAFASRIHSLICINSPTVYISKPFSRLKQWINTHLSKQVYYTCRTKSYRISYRKDYLYNFFFIGNGISILEKKKVIANLSELNKKILKIPDLNKVINEERSNLPFRTKTICKKISKQLDRHLQKAYKQSRLPNKMNPGKYEKYT